MTDDIERQVAEANADLQRVLTEQLEAAQATVARLSAALDTSRAEIDRLSALVSVSPDDIREVADENTRVEAENERLRRAFDEVIKSLDSGGSVRSAFCTWCNQRWPQLDGETYEVARKYTMDHAEVCPANATRIERDNLRADIARLQADVSTLRAARSMTTAWGDYRDRAKAEVTQILEMPESSGIDAIVTGIRGVKDERDRLRARVEQLTETARAAGENWMSACRQRDEARQEVDRLTAAAQLARSGVAEAVHDHDRNQAKIAALEDALREACGVIGNTAMFDETMLERLQAIANGGSK